MYVNGNAEAGAGTPAPAVQQVPPVSNTQPQNSRFVFKPAVKYDAKLRFAIAGPGGSGKTYTLLRIATEIVRLTGGKIAFVDSEHGSARKYADLFQFDVLELDSFDPAIVPDLIKAVHEQGYTILIIDSWSHFWMGTDGELAQVDRITARSKSGNSFAAWRDVSPKHTKMIDAILAAPIHILVSMRVKTEWVIEVDERTKKSSPKRVGLQPVMRDGVEYEFDVCGDIDIENTLVITKSRCPKLSGKVFQQPGEDVAGILREWLASPIARPAEEPKPVAIAATSTDGQFRWRNMREYWDEVLVNREKVGEVVYRAELERFGWKSAEDIKRAIDRKHPQAREHAAEFADRLASQVRKEVA